MVNVIGVPIFFPGRASASLEADVTTGRWLTENWLWTADEQRGFIALLSQMNAKKSFIPTSDDWDVYEHAAGDVGVTVESHQEPPAHDDVPDMVAVLHIWRMTLSPSSVQDADNWMFSLSGTGFGDAWTPVTDGALLQSYAHVALVSQRSQTPLPQASAQMPLPLHEQTSSPLLSVVQPAAPVQPVYWFAVYFVLSHVPPVQEGAPHAPYVSGHTVPHEPQFTGSVFTLTSHPVDATWSQLPVPTGQAMQLPVEQ